MELASLLLYILQVSVLWGKYHSLREPSGKFETQFS